jgi:hypothetical protein
MTAVNSAVIDALAQRISELRNGRWQTKVVAKLLAQIDRPFEDLVADAIDAAKNPDLIQPRVLLTHRQSNTSQPDPRRIQQLPPPITRCPTCGSVSDIHTNDHCRHRPATAQLWRAELMATIKAKYADKIKEHERKETADGYAAAAQLRQQWQNELADGMARGPVTDERYARSA